MLKNVFWNLVDLDVCTYVYVFRMHFYMVSYSIHIIELRRWMGVFKYEFNFGFIFNNL